MENKRVFLLDSGGAVLLGSKQGIDSLALIF